MALGLAYAGILWFMAAVTLVRFEMSVHVLRPRVRALYATAAFAAGLLLAAGIARHH